MEMLAAVDEHHSGGMSSNVKDAYFGHNIGKRFLNSSKFYFFLFGPIVILRSFKTMAAKLYFTVR